MSRWWANSRLRPNVWHARYRTMKFFDEWEYVKHNNVEYEVRYYLVTFSEALKLCKYKLNYTYSMTAWVAHACFIAVSCFINFFNIISILRFHGLTIPSFSVSPRALLRRPIAGSQVPYCPIDKKLSDSWSPIEPNTFKVRGPNYFRWEHELGWLILLSTGNYWHHSSDTFCNISFISWYVLYKSS